MNDHVDPKRLLQWCRVPADQLVGHPGLRVPFRMVADAREMGRLMARELVDLVAANNAAGRPTRAIVPCGPSVLVRALDGDGQRARRVPRAD